MGATGALRVNANRFGLRAALAGRVHSRYAGLPVTRYA